MSDAHSAAQSPDSHGAARDPVAYFLADPQSHLSDILYLYFRFYKRRLLDRFFEQAVRAWESKSNGHLTFADVGASMGFDYHYMLNCRTDGFKHPPRWGKTSILLVEGDAALIAAGDREWNAIQPEAGISHRYIRADLAKELPLTDNSCEVIICSEVVEHLEEPVRLLKSICRSLKPGGYLIFTTDNSPSLFQQARRIPVWLKGRYRRAYERPRKSETIVGEVTDAGGSSPIYGHINLNPTRHWEKCCRQAGLEVVSFGSYESVRRGGGSKSPAGLAFYFVAGFVVSLLPARLGRFFGDTTALLLRKPFRPTGSGR